MRSAALVIVLTSLVLGLGACDDTPSGPRLDQPVDTLRGAAARASSAGFPACTKHWKSGTSGPWGVARNWTPVGVPGRNAVACLDAPGTYSVTLATPDTLAGIIVGAATGTKATLVYQPTMLGTARLTTGLWIRKGSTFRHLGGTFEPSWVLIDGRLKAEGNYRYLTADSLVNQGTLEVPLGGDLQLTVQQVRNAGTVSAGGDATFILAAGSSFRMEGGTFSGAGRVDFNGSPTLPRGLVVWTGGTLPTPAPGVTPYITFAALNVELGTTTLAGQLTLDRLGTTGIDTVYGDIGPGVFLQLVGDRGGGYALVNRNGSPVINTGTISAFSGLTDPSLPYDVLAAGGLINRGTLTLKGSVTSGLQVNLKLDSLINEGLLAVKGLEWMSGGLLRNRGTVTVDRSMRLEMIGSTFVAESASVQTGQLGLTGGTVTGTGSAGDVIAAGGIVAPGNPIGALTLASLTLDLTSRTEIELGGTTSAGHDALLVTGPVSYGGTLDLHEVAPFQGGACGQVVPILLDHSTGSRGAFATIQGGAPAPGRGWRLDTPTDSLVLVGHDPAYAVSFGAESLAVVEGRPAVGYAVCLRSAPAATVAVTPASTSGQGQAGAPLSFSTSSWSRPLALTVSAVDDTLVEAPHQSDRITHDITSVDPVFDHAVVPSVALDVGDNDGRADLQLQVLTQAPVVAVGSSFKLKVRIGNSGPTLTTGATYSVSPATGLVIQSVSGPIGCSTGATGVTCQVRGLTPGEFQDVAIIFQATAAGTVTDTLSVVGDQPDPSLGNNLKRQVVTVN